MPRSFAISTIADRVNLDEARRGSTSITVTNSTGKPLRAWPELKELGSTKKEWLTLEGGGEKSFSPNEAQTFKVTVVVPNDAAAGRYEFKLNMISGTKGSEEESTEGPVVSFEVVPRVIPKPGPPIWLFIVLGVFVLSGIVTAIVLLLPSKVTIPDLKGKNVTDATALLEKISLTNKVEYQHITTNSAGTVFNQNPNPGDKAKKGATVTVFVEMGLAPSTVPDFTSPHFTLEQALPVANAANIKLDTKGSQFTPDPKLNGRVVNQDHPAGKSVPQGTTVCVTFGTTNKLRIFIDPAIKARLIENQNFRRVGGGP